MRWINFLLLLLAALVIQTGIGRLAGLGPQKIMPDLMLMLAVLLAFRGRGYGILVACWILGLMRDMTSDAVLGTYSLGFGLMGMMVVRLRELLYADRPLTVILLTFICAFSVEQLAVAIAIIREDLASDQYGTITLAITFSALFTSALAPYGQWLIMKMHHFLGLPPQRSYR